MLWFIKRRLLSNRAALGKWGEKRGEKFLKSKGYKTLAHNYLCRTGELDIVSADPEGTIVFVEVKTRTTRDVTEPEDTVTKPKRDKLTRTAQYFLKTHDITDRPCQFDIIAITLDPDGHETIKHYPNAFVP